MAGDQMRVLIAQSFPVLGNGLAAVLQDADVDVVAQTLSGRDTLEAAAELQPDVVVLDLSLPDMDSIHVIKELTKRLASGRILAMGLTENISEMVDALDTGAAGYFVARDPADECLRAVRSMFEKGFFLSNARVGALAEHSNRPEGRSSWRKVVSPQEYELLKCFARCMTLQEAAEALDVAPTTVSTYRQRLLTKLKLPNTAHLIKFAIENKVDT